MPEVATQLTPKALYGTGFIGYLRPESGRTLAGLASRLRPHSGRTNSSRSVKLWSIRGFRLRPSRPDSGRTVALAGTPGPGRTSESGRPAVPIGPDSARPDSDSYQSAANKGRRELLQRKDFEI